MTLVRTAFVGCALISIAACGGAHPPLQEGTAPPPEATDDVAATHSPRPAAASSGETAAGQRTAPPPESTEQGEIVPLLAPIPAPLMDGDHLPEDPSLLREEATRLLADGRRVEALPLIDVLLILDPSDWEMLETRGVILLEEGHMEDGADDLRRCCDSGRASCCR